MNKCSNGVVVERVDDIEAKCDALAQEYPLYLSFAHNFRSSGWFLQLQRWESIVEMSLWIGQPMLSLEVWSVVNTDNPVSMVCICFLGPLTLLIALSVIALTKELQVHIKALETICSHLVSPFPP